MAAKSLDFFSNTSTSVEITCPDDTTGIERIMLAAQGDLQRLLSSFFARPISVERVYADTSPRLAPASPDHPITQKRQVQLKCASRIVCIATSFVALTSPECERLFLDEKFAIGQLFRQLRVAPKFTLLKVETRAVDGKRELERTYRLETAGISCDITEVFPDRDMFVLGRAWLDDAELLNNGHEGKQSSVVQPPIDAPQTLAAAATLSSILYGRDVDPLSEQKANGASDISYAHFSKLVEVQSFVWYDRLSSLLPPKSIGAPVVAVLGDSGLHSTVTTMALLRLNVTVFFLTPSDPIAPLAYELAARRVFAVVYDRRYADTARSVADKLSIPVVAQEDAEDAKVPAKFSPWHGKRCKTLYDTPPAIPIIVYNPN
ncbi:hypothetical protein NEOLEDRAFT_1182183 [Neolentinus lepideus HHB14362 ss-1]|uniref:Uncharacterized protein n=1 Tax=Neolentinus lepideus HHB14362 ss-1 TaxID=1314782 RepID=A0A165PCV4_9AGAM|nr:hypothetical protein NEOLEDRAFT_1182183 [Neolentinus lepideus HHB14362 ss-1]